MGFEFNNVTGAITITGGSAPLIIQDTDGLTFQDNAGTQSVNFKVTGTTQVTISGETVINNGAISQNILTLQDNATAVFEVLDGGNVDFHTKQAIRFVAENQTTDPVSDLVEGRLFWDTNDDILRAYTGSSWVTVGPGSTSTITGTLTSGEVVYATGTNTVDSDAQFLWNTSTKTFTLGDGGTTKTRFVQDAGTLGTGENALARTATLNTSASNETAITETVTSAGSGVVTKIARTIAFASGYTAAGSTYTFNATNSVAGTGADLQLTTTETGILGNQAIRGLAAGSTVTGYNIGVHGEAGHGLFNVGTLGKAITSTNATNNIGALGVANSASTNNVGGYFALGGAATPSFTSAALLLDNGTVAAPIIVARDNGTAVYTVGDGGLITHSVGTMATGNIAYNYSGTIIGSTAADQTAFFESHTAGSGTGTGDMHVRKVVFNSGYTGAATTTCLFITTSVASTGTTNSFSSEAVKGNLGAWIDVTGNTTGNKIGIRIDVAGTGTGNAIGGESIVSAASATNAWGFIASAAAGTNKTGGYFGLFTSLPTADTCGLIADNGSVAAPIFKAKDNGTTVFSVIDGGNVDFTNKESINHRVENVIADPTAGNAGRLIWNTISSALKVDNGASWTSLGGGGITGTLTSGEVVYATGTSTVDSDAQFLWNTSTKTFTLGDGGTTKTRFTSHSGQLGTGEYAFDVTCLTSASAGGEIGFKLTTSSAGTGGTHQGANFFMSGSSFAGNAAHSLQGRTNIVGATGTFDSSGSLGGAYGLVGKAEGTNTGTALMCGVAGYGGGSTNGVGIGVAGCAPPGTGVSTFTSVGVLGMGYQGGSTTRVGGFFCIAGSVNTLTFANAALMADNNSISDPIFIARDNGTNVFRILDGGIADFHKNESNNFRFENRTSDISSPSEGLVYWHTSEESLKVYDGAVWRPVNGLIAQPATGTWTGTTITLTAGDSVNFGDACYINSSGQAKIADADSSTTANVTVIALATISASSSGLFLVSGTLTHTTNISVTAGAKVFLSTTGTSGNTLTATAPSGSGDIVQILGWAIATNTILWQPCLVQVEVA